MRYDDTIWHSLLFLKSFSAFKFADLPGLVTGGEGRSVYTSVMISDSVMRSNDFYDSSQNYGN